MPTLLEVLQRKNPDIVDHWAGSSYKNTTSTRFDEVTLDDGCRAHVQEWKDFTFGSIYLAYGDILDQELAASYRAVQTPTATPTTIVDENGIDTLGIAWSCNIERAPLKAAGAILRGRMGMTTPALAGAPDHTLASKIISWRHPTVLDRALSKKYRHANPADPEKHLVYAVGDSKLKQKWKSGWLRLADAACTVSTDAPYHRPGTPAPAYQKTKDISTERLKPLKQMATYCRYGETRYGYLITQTELVAMRVRRIPGTSNHNAAVEYRLTAHLAIWALGCMGMNDNHRAMENSNNTALSHMAKLTWWSEDKVNNTFTNVISHRILTAAQWAKLPATTVAALQTDDSGKSPTSSFTQAPALPAVTRQMANLTVSNPPTQAGATQQKQSTVAAVGSVSKTSTTAAPKKSYTKCTIGNKTYNLTKNTKGHYVILDSKGKVKYTIVQNSKKSWVVSEDPKAVVAKME